MLIVVLRNHEINHDLMVEENALQFVTNEKRKGKALLYWMTSTSTSTLFSYTATTTLGLFYFLQHSDLMNILGTVECTPSGFTISACGK